MITTYQIDRVRRKASFAHAECFGIRSPVTVAGDRVQNLFQRGVENAFRRIGMRFVVVQSLLRARRKRVSVVRTELLFGISHRDGRSDLHHRVDHILIVGHPILVIIEKFSQHIRRVQQFVITGLFRRIDVDTENHNVFGKRMRLGPIAIILSHRARSPNRQKQYAEKRRDRKDRAR